jgi:uncharacterized protein YndB with AHSA1/START domain
VTIPRREPIVQERVVRAPVEAVFRAWSDPESLSLWMCPADDMTPATVEVDFRVGGGFRITMHGADQGYEHEGEYLEIEAPKRLVFSWISHFVPAPYSRTRVSVAIEALGERESRVTLVHDELPDTDHYDGHTDGWSEILRKLAQELSAESDEASPQP